MRRFLCRICLRPDSCGCLDSLRGQLRVATISSIDPLAEHIACAEHTSRFGMHTFGCTISIKKTLISVQNLENKGSEFSLPSRSMVLKVVTGKIFKTLEL